MEVFEALRVVGVSVLVVVAVRQGVGPSLIWKLLDQLNRF